MIKPEICSPQIGGTHRAMPSAAWVSRLKNRAVCVVRAFHLHSASRHEVSRLASLPAATVRCSCLWARAMEATHEVSRQSGTVQQKGRRHASRGRGTSDSPGCRSCAVAAVDSVVAMLGKQFVSFPAHSSTSCLLGQLAPPQYWTRFPRRLQGEPCPAACQRWRRHGGGAGGRGDRCHHAGRRAAAPPALAWLRAGAAAERGALRAAGQAGAAQPCAERAGGQGLAACRGGAAAGQHTVSCACMDSRVGLI